VLHHDTKVVIDQPCVLYRILNFLPFLLIWPALIIKYTGNGKFVGTIVKVMEHVEKIDTVRQYNNMLGVDTLHPLVSVINFDELPPVINTRMHLGIYAVFMKNIKCGDIRYGCQPYDYEDGTLIFIGPGQTYGIDGKGLAIKPSGYGLVFHPDLITGTHLGKAIKDYTFFSYEVTEALHLSKKERTTIVDCFKKIDTEIDQNIDKHSKTLIVSNIELLLNYCMRFYDRQFITRGNVNRDILVRFEHRLKIISAQISRRHLVCLV
jgi:hypothetical protein